MQPVIELRMRDDLTAAMKARDSARVTVLRSALAAIANAEAPDIGAPAWPPPQAGATEAERLVLTSDDHSRIVSNEIADREHTIAQYEANGRPAEAGVLRDEITILCEYLDS